MAATITIRTAELSRALRSGEAKTARDLGFLLLNQVTGTMKATQRGDSRRNNLALNVFENALDWRLGFLALALLRKAAETGSQRKLTVELTRGGKILSLPSRTPLEV